MSDQTVVEELLGELQQEGKGEYSFDRHDSNYSMLIYNSKEYEDCVYFEFDDNGKLFDISGGVLE